MEIRPFLALIAALLLGGLVRAQEISFSQTRVVAMEGTGIAPVPVAIPLQRTGGTAGTAFAIIRVTDTTTGDFFAGSNSVFFVDGISEASGSLSVVNDDIAEGNETFIVEIVSASGATVGSPSTMELVILANDEPFGRVQFNQASLSVVTEEAAQSVSFQVQRGPGIFGTIGVMWEVIASSDVSSDDVTPTSGEIIFPDLVSTQQIIISINADDIPENNEQFTVRLVSVTGGGMLSSTDTEAMLTILENDSPIRFNQSEYRVLESDGTVNVTITRGLLEDGMQVGPINLATNVTLTTMNGTATPGQDYITQQTVISFPAGSTSITEEIDIIDDTNPEGDETFFITLSDPGSSSVLYSPSTTMVVIEVSDDAGGIVSFVSTTGVTISEDGSDGTTAMLTVQRTVGTNGDITVSWTVLDNDNNPAASDFMPPNGTVTIPHRDSQVVLEITAFDDNDPETPELFTVMLNAVVEGSGRLGAENERIVSLMVRDSDDAYGRIEWGAEDQLRVNPDPRRLELTIIRAGGSEGVITVEYNAVYLPPGTTDPANGEMSVFTNAANSVSMLGGQNQATVQIGIATNAFLEQEGSFWINITGVLLTSSSTLLPRSQLSSPRIGTRSSLLISVPQEVANGEISFASQSLMVTAMEPEIGLTAVTLVITRSGFSGDATVFWSAMGISADFNLTSDIIGTASTVTIPSGSNNATITLAIQGDDEPEIEEQFQVALTFVIPINQRISSNDNTSIITISRNDNPDGVFQFAASTAGPYRVNESNIAVIPLVIERTGGSLSAVSILYQTNPIGQTDLIGAAGLETFSRGETLVQIFIIAVDDVIPEIDEMYTIQLSQLDGGTDLLGSRTSVDITITKNDDANGIFSFAQDSLQISIAEIPPNFSGDIAPYRAVFTVQRMQGLFEDVVVNWTVVNVTSHISPTQGGVLFRHNQNSATFYIDSVSDNIPEGNQTFTVKLSINDLGRLDLNSDEAQLTILQNDDPISFTRSSLSVNEGEELPIRVTRGGQAAGLATATFQLSFTTAASDDVEMLSTYVVTFTSGITVDEISLNITDDDIPELAEHFTVELINTTGDAVIVSPSIITIEISENDDPYGVFLFTETSLSLMEGDLRNQLRVNRTRGTFGNSTVMWGVFNSRNQSTLSGEDISVTFGTLTFLEDEDYQLIEFDIVDDTEPELAEVFEFWLLNVDSGELGSSGRVASVTIQENDDPYGAYEFGASSRAVEIPEDIPVGGSAMVDLNVTRNQGTFGTVTVVWEVLLENGAMLPSFTDLLLASTTTSLAMLTGRLHTNTTAYRFNGSNSTAVVMDFYTPSVAGNFSVSVWVMPTVPGLLMSKRTLDSGLTSFNLSLIFDSGNYQIQFQYTYQTASMVFSTAVVESSSIAESILEDGDFHHIAVTITQTMASIYFHGTNVAIRTLSGAVVDTSNSELVVGSGSFVGAIQDARFYSSALSTNDVVLLSGDGAAAHVTPITGYLQYQRGVDMQSITVTSMDDDIAEPSTPLVVSLGFSSSKGRIIDRPNSQANLTVLKSDRANGQFAFANESLVPRMASEADMLSFEVVREGGSFGSVMVIWEVRPLSNGGSTEDFDPFTDEILFDPQVTNKTFDVVVVNENIPELAENFIIVLVSAVALDNETSSTDTSGASISATNAQVAVTVEENDHPYGLLQFTTSSPPAPGDPFVPAASESPVLSVMEENGTIRLHVVRAQGSEGTVSVEYQTVDGTAIASGVRPDYQTNVGTLNFPPGVRAQSIDIVLNDDAIPELQKAFTVELSNPLGSPQAPSLGAGSRITIQIEPSDDAFGVFSFTADSLVQVVEEAPSTQVTFTIQRMGGALGEVIVYWEARRFAEDVVPSSGNVSFVIGQIVNTFTVTILEDQLPELAEIVTIALVNVTGGGRLSDTGNTEAMITIQASDDPYGVFSFPLAFRPLHISETMGSVNIVVSRLFGREERVVVHYTTLPAAPTQINRDPDNLATAGGDYEADDGRLIFEANQTSANITITIYSDDLPELDESVFIRLTSAYLFQEDGSGGNAIGVRIDTDSSIAEIIIVENDDARGVVQFSSTEYNTTEPHTEQFLTVTRSRGTFGLITIQWTATIDTADFSDFTPIAGVINIFNGENESAIPISIINDNIPEFSERFTIELTSVSGGANLGATRTTTVTILPNDDPNGALEFASGSRMVTVAEAVGTTVVVLTVNRIGGSVGVVSADWQLTRSGGSDPADDIQPVTGSVQFITSMTERTITLEIQPDNIPEDDEVFIVTLSNPTGGARITTNSQANITISANDNPYGTVMFSQGSFTAEEGNPALLTLRRSFGTFGDLQIFYTVRTLDLAIFAERAGRTVTDYFLSPVADTTIIGSSIGSFSSLGSSALTACSSQCLSQRACQSFVLDTSASSCVLYAVSRTSDNSASSSGVQYYEKDNDLVRPLERSQAENDDFMVASNASTTISAGIDAGEISVNTVGDNTPELNETFIVVLNSVQVVGRTVLAENEPQLGSTSIADVIIYENDDARGQFFLYTNTDMNAITVPESDNLAVTLTVRRMGGTIGNVVVSWGIASGTATTGDDYMASGASITFQDGMDSSIIILSILEDSIPERDEDIVVQLTGVTGGARIADGDGGRVVVTIMANDRAAGVVGFAPSSRSAVVSEGEQVTLTAVRTVSSLGRVRITWEITGPEVSAEFANINGSTVFNEGDNTTSIILNVLTDAVPEISEPYTVNITSVETLSTDISSSDGVAILDQISSTAIITIRASDNPHGIVEFQSSSLDVTTDESAMLELTIIRMFGTIGAIMVSFEAQEGSLSSLSIGQSLATSGEDFNASTQNVILQNRQASTVIQVPLIDDGIPELTEIFIVQLTDVQLVDSVQDIIPPALGNESVSQVTVTPNDSPQGEIGFSAPSFRVGEDIGQFNLTVLRNRGVFGEVSVLYGVININTNAMGLPTDYITMTSGILTFGDGVMEQVIPITIGQDDVPEVDEQFQVELNNPMGGAILGTFNQTVVTIEANDDPNGVFSFALTTFEVEESQIVGLEIRRNRGLFGRITVLYEVEANGTDEISPATGGVVFEAGVDSMILELTAVSDGIPELNETYTVQLTEVVGGGRLDESDTAADITILLNENPYGVFQLMTDGSGMLDDGQTAIIVNETQDEVEFLVLRSFGLFGEVSIRWSIRPLGSNTLPGQDYLDQSEVLTFAEDEANETFIVTILEDDIPEILEAFQVLLSEPTGGAQLGANNSTIVGIRTNDNAHGIIGFAPSSQSLTVQENGTVVLMVERRNGTFGTVRVNWELRGDHTGGEIQPSSGEVSFLPGIMEDNIILIIQSDNLPELTEITEVVLTEVTDDGIENMALQLEGEIQGAYIDDASRTAVISVAANDFPHGQITWDSASLLVMVPEPNDTAVAIELTLIRLSGAIGDIIITYSTVNGSAIAGEDYTFTSGTVEMMENVTSATISVTILADDIPEIAETFLVSITNITLADGTLGQDSLSPRALPGAENAEIQINENDNARGILNFDVDLNFEGTVGIAENIRTFAVTVTRSAGTTGVVGCSIAATSITAESVDYNIDMGPLVFNEGQNTTQFIVTIVNDAIPELEETFEISIIQPTGGARVGDNGAFIVTILRNDDVNGVFTFALDTLVLLVPESMENSSEVATFRVMRRTSFVGTVVVEWAVSDDGRNDLEPDSGTLIFPENTTEQQIMLRAISDNQPEPSESFTVSLLTASNGGRLSAPQSASIVISASDDPMGVLGFDSYPLGIVVNEGENFTATILRSAGTLGEVSVVWQLTPMDTNTFQIISDSVTLINGQQSANFTVSTLQDSNPEIARQYTLALVSSLQGRLAQNDSEIEVIVASSDYPHGVVQFQAPAFRETQEGSGVITIPVLRNAGIIGTIRVNYSVEPMSATAGSDYRSTETSLTIADRVATGAIQVSIINDNEPELDETFVVTLLSVELLDSFDDLRGFPFAGDNGLIDMPPTLGAVDQLEITILESDNARGVVSFDANMFQAVEGRTAYINLTRSSGTFGDISVQYNVTDGSARGNGQDYIIASTQGEVVFTQGQEVAVIMIPIRDDALPELQEQFFVELTGATGGASIAGITVAAVIIEPSDDPNGVVGFSFASQTEVTIENPPTTGQPVNVNFTVQRTGGDIGATVVQWVVTGPSPGRESDDIDPTTLQGFVSYGAGESGTQTIRVTVLPDAAPEAEEVYTVRLLLASGDAIIDPSADTATLTISQRGNPFGTVGFVGEALQPQNFMENPVAPVNISLPIGRTGGDTGTMQVFFVVEGPPGLHLDITPVNGSATILDGQVRGSIDISILSEDIPEMAEVFMVVITRVEGGAELSDRLTSTFTIGSNDAPHGVFVVGSAVVATSGLGSATSRQLNFTISRQFGSQETVLVTISIYYDQLPGVMYVPGTSVITFADGVQQQTLTFPIAVDAFLSFGAAFNITITNVTLSDPSGSDSVPEISTLFGSTVAMITEQVANPLIGFDDASIEASVSDAVTTNNVQLTINRFGQVGVIQVIWRTGSNQFAGVENGSVVPIIGSIEMQPTDSTASISLTAVARVPHGQAEIFSVQLSVLSQIPGFAAGVRREAATSTIEPYGVVQLSHTSYIGTEGRNANITVWRRFGSRGSIMVTGIATAVTQVGTNQSPAQAVIDFPTTPLSVVIADGMTTGTITIPLGDNNVIGSPKVFQFNLTSVERVPAVQSRVSSPRLASSMLNSQVVIADDEGGSGIFQFTSSGSLVAEDGSPLVQAIVARGGGNFGRVEVLVRSVDGRIGTDTSTSATATSGLDYESFSQTLVFESGEVEKSIIIRVLDDDIPELLEYFTLELTDPSGGALLAGTATTFEVSIRSNDNPGGVFSLTPLTLQLDEEQFPARTITVVRDPGLFGTVQINWRTVLDPEVSHTVTVNDLLVESLGSVSFLPNVTSATIELQLRPNSVPQNGEQFTVEIFSNQQEISIVNNIATVTVLPSPLSVFQFAQTSRTIVIASGSTAQLLIERTRGVPLIGEVSISTQSPSGAFTYQGLTIQPAIGAEHYGAIRDTIRMDSGVSTADFSVPIVDIQSVTNFRGFYVELDAANRSNTQVQNGQALVILSPPVEGMLLSLYTELQLATTVPQLESVANSLLAIITQGQIVGTNLQQSSLVQLVLDGIPSAIEANNLRYSGALQNTLLDIYNMIMTSEIFRYQSQYFTSLQQFGYSLLIGSACPRTDSLFYTRSSFYMELTYTTPEALRGQRFTASRDPSFSDVTDYLIFPSTVISGTSNCLRVNFLTLRNQTIFFTPTPNLRSVSLSIGIQNQLVTGTSPLTYRIYGESSSGSRTINVTRQECVRFEYPATSTASGRWAVDDSCFPVLLDNGGYPTDYVECQCTTFGEFAARREATTARPIPDQDDDEKKWLPSGPISCAAVMITMLLIIILHILYYQKMQQPTKLFVNLCISIFLFQAIALVNMLVTDSASETGCTVLSILTQLTVIAQFAWIAALGTNFWMTFLGYSEGKEPLIGFILIVWAIPVLIVVATILIVRFVFDDDINGEIYGREFDTTYYFCYMPNHWVALVSTVLPIVVCLMCMAMLFSHACIFWSKWEQYDDLYYYSHNYREVPRMLVFFLVITLPWLFGSLHAYLGTIYLLVLFQVFNYLQAIYAIVVYFFLSWRTMLRKQQSYSPKDDIIPLQTPPPSVAQQTLSGPIAGSTRDLLAADQLQEEWDQSQHGSSVGNESLPSSIVKHRPVSPPTDQEDSQLDDIMFMLKTGGSYSMEEGIRESYATNATDETDTTKPSSSEHYELRHISIADTHL